MSQEAVIQFFQALSQEKDLQGQLNYAFATAAPQQLIQVASENGYSFTPEELSAVLDNQGELSDQQLEAVAGGRRPQFVEFTNPDFIQAMRS
ncbi:MAG: Nif11-like leader peptide family RiPP precursor [Aphanothece sp. CMT-3BRIN-NPC111]|jgi:predicted ribosomally synthesized peptide with nif11-like leader|nr:Nif11-like leader peptide family RiPP precursor [Aphanothece sp. CMT-3BRIN-NPC111]